MRRAINRDLARQGRKFELIPDEVTLYGYRHRFITEWLVSGKPVAHAAALLGTSIKMIETHYSHLADHGHDLRRQLLDFRRGTADAAPSPPSVAS
jgi:hypothetical protein